MTTCRASFVRSRNSRSHGGLRSAPWELGRRGRLLASGPPARRSRHGPRTGLRPPRPCRSLMLRLHGSTPRATFLRAARFIVDADRHAAARRNAWQPRRCVAAGGAWFVAMSPRASRPRESMSQLLKSPLSREGTSRPRDGGDRPPSGASWVHFAQAAVFTRHLCNGDHCPPVRAAVSSAALHAAIASCGRPNQ